MMPTPTVTETAIIRAATATAVRLSEATTPRLAIRPRLPKSRPNGGRISRMRTTVAPGVSRAKPSTMSRRAAKLAIRFSPGMNSSAVPPARRASPARETRGRARRVACSMVERLRTARGGAEVASSAGSRAARNVASVPRMAPFARARGEMARSRTETTK